MFRLTVIKDYGPKSTRIPSQNSRGNGRDRQAKRIVDCFKTTIDAGRVPPGFSFDEIKAEHKATKPTSLKEKLDLTEEKLLVAEAQVDYYRSQLAEEKMARSQDWEKSLDSSQVPINPTVERAAGLDTSTSTPLPSGRNKAFKKEITSKKHPQPDHSKDAPVVTPQLSDKEVKRRTGFNTQEDLLTYIFVVCNGDVDKITKGETVLTWYEKWFCHFEYKWGRTATRMIDLSAIYGPHRRFLHRVISDKYNIERQARDSWPRYVTLEEDEVLRKPGWELKFGDNGRGKIRIVFWDMTNVPAYAFSDPDLNRITYSKYYNQNCFKGEVGLQLCGWILVAPLWTGAVSDTDYNKRAGYLRDQEEFAKIDLVDIDGTLTVVVFTNIYDKGYRAKMVAWRAGKQLVLQPVWAESDKRFSRGQTLRTASVARDRGGNERAVNVCKRAWYISRGFQENSSAKLLNNAWLTWAFQSNFMFAPVQ